VAGYFAKIVRKLFRGYSESQLNFPNEIRMKVEYLLRLWGAKSDELAPLAQRVKTSRRLNIQHLANVMGAGCSSNTTAQQKNATTWAAFLVQYTHHSFLAVRILWRDYGILQPGPEIGRIQRSIVKKTLR